MSKPAKKTAARVVSVKPALAPGLKATVVLAPNADGVPSPVLSPAPKAGATATAPVPPGPFGFRPPKYPLSGRITVLIAYNPKRPGTKAAAKFPLYEGAKTVADLIAAFRAAGYPSRRAYSALRFDTARGFVRVD